MFGMNEITNDEVTIDSREVIARIEYLESLADDGDATPEDMIELEALRTLADDGESCAEDWAHGATLIRDDYFPEYARQYAEDIGAISDASEWPLTCIDWHAAARDLQQDYSTVEFRGSTYWVR